MIGVYSITNTATGQKYIGRSVRIDRRLYGHLRTLRLGSHDNPYLQASFNKYGESAFSMGPLILCRRDDLPFYERLLIGGYRSDNPKLGFNLTIAIEDRLTHTAAARSAIGAFQRVFQREFHYLMTPAIAEKIAAKLRGKPTGRKGLKFPPEKRARSGAPKGNKNRLGKTRTDDEKARISVSVKARLASDADLRARLSAIRKGKKQSPALIAKRNAWRLKPK